MGPAKIGGHDLIFFVLMQDGLDIFKDWAKAY